MHKGYLAALASACLFFPVAQASAQAVAGPLSPDNGFPRFYRDGAGQSLDLCLSNSGFCLLDAAVQLLDPTQPFPLNYGGTFPEESFYWAGSAKMPTNGNGSAILVMALEAAFVNGPVLPGDQITFGRLRVRVDNLIAGQTYRVTTPYGVFSFIATNSAARGINSTRDIGGVPGDFQTALTSGILPFLRWDTGLPIVDVDGRQFIGDPAIDHTVTGSPIGKNTFQIDGPSVGGPGVNRISTNLFSVMGMVSIPPPVANFSATPTSGAPPLSVAFTDLSTGSITSRSWDFGDGATSLLPSPTHVYSLAGSYTVSLTVTGPGGANTRTVPNLINVGVAAPPPALTLGEAVPGIAGRKNTFTVTGVTPNAVVFLIGSTSAGAGAIRASNCTVVTGLANPTIMANTRAVGTTATFTISLNGSLAGVNFLTQAIDSGNCHLSNVVSHVY